MIQMKLLTHFYESQDNRLEKLIGFKLDDTIFTFIDQICLYDPNDRGLFHPKTLPWSIGGECCVRQFFKKFN